MTVSTSTQKRKKWLPWVLGALFVALIAAAAIKGRQKPKGEEIEKETVAKRTIREVVGASGKIFPETEVKISSDVSGEVIELYVKEGDSVTIGQVLAKIKPDEYQSLVEQGEATVNSARAQREISSSNINSASAQLEQAKADLRRAASALDMAKSNYKRNEKLFQEGVISNAEWENIQNNLKSAEAGVAVAEAAVKTAETNLGNTRENVRVSDFSISSANARLKEMRTSLQKTIITAPMSGIVSQLNIEKGERVVGTLQMTGTEIMRVANLRRMEVQVEVSENDIVKVALGDEAEIEVDAFLGRKFKGKVSEIANSASSVASALSLNTDQVTNFIVKISMDPASYADLIQPGRPYPFRPRMSASVDIFTQTAENVLSVPLVSVTTRQEDKADDKEDKEDEPEKETKVDLSQIEEIVFVVVGDTVAVRTVKTGIQDNDYIEIINGLTEGETVVSGPYSAIARKLKSGSRVTEMKKKKEKEKD